MKGQCLEIEKVENDPVYVKLKRINYFKKTFLENNDSYVFADFSKVLLKRLMDNKMTEKTYNSILNHEKIISAYRMKKQEKHEIKLTDKIKDCFEKVVKIIKGKYQENQEITLELPENYIGERGYFR